MTPTTMHDDWSEALLATARRLDVKVVEEAQKQARVILRGLAKINRDFHKDRMRAISIKLERDIAASNAQIAAQFSNLRQSQADEKVLAFSIAAHDKKEGAQ